jgi:threonine dehydrogenase-like Zn-dependent dehydrogenase
MKGVVFLGNRQCEVRDFPLPEPGNGEVRIKMKVSGICGSDLHVYRAAQAGDNVQGHESCGVVDKLGQNVVRDVDSAITAQLVTTSGVRRTRLFLVPSGNI